MIRPGQPVKEVKTIIQNEENDIILATPSTWEAISRKWRDERVWRDFNL